MILAVLSIAAQDVQPIAPLNSPREWITDSDYPEYALRFGHQGTVAFDLTVDETGKVADCAVTGASGYQELDMQTCRLVIQRARFRPARRAGKAITAHYRNSLFWTLPAQTPISLTDWHRVAVMKISTDGEILSCDDQSTGVLENRIDPCQVFRATVPSSSLSVIGGTGSPWTLTFELAMTVKGSAEQHLRYFDAGQAKSALVRVAFDISERGTVGDCRSVPTGEEKWLAMKPSLCVRRFETYVPSVGVDGKPRATSATLAMAISKAP